MFAAVFLMKAMSHGAVAEKEPAVLDLQRRILECFRDAAVDEEHIASEIATLLGRVFPTVQPPPPPTREKYEGGETYPPAYYDGFQQPQTQEYFDGPDMFANWGFDPVLILNGLDAGTS